MEGLLLERWKKGRAPWVIGMASALCSVSEKATDTPGSTLLVEYLPQSSEEPIGTGGRRGF